MFQHPSAAALWNKRQALVNEVRLIDEYLIAQEYQRQRDEFIRRFPAEFYNRMMANRQPCPTPSPPPPPPQQPTSESTATTPTSLPSRVPTPSPTRTPTPRTLKRRSRYDGRVEFLFTDKDMSYPVNARMYLRRHLARVLSNNVNKGLAGIQRLMNFNPYQWSILLPRIKECLSTVTIECYSMNTPPMSFSLTKVKHNPTSALPEECWCKGRWCVNGQPSRHFKSYRSLIHMLVNIFRDEEIPELPDLQENMNTNLPFPSPLGLQGMV